MRISVSRSKNAASYYIVDSFRDLSGKVKTKIVQKLGTEESIRAEHGDVDPMIWAKEKLAEALAGRDAQKLSGSRKITVTLNEKKDKAETSAVRNAGCLMLDSVYHEFGLSNICEEIHAKHVHVRGFNLDTVLRAMLFCRILEPSSKLRLADRVQRRLLESTEIEIQHVYRAMDLIEEHWDLIQSRLFYYSNKSKERDIHRLYYDCTNFFCETECEDCDVGGKSKEWHEEHTLRKYGKSKENRPSPIVQLGMFTDGGGLPVGMCVFPGNESEKPTMQPLEAKLLENFKKADIVVCAAAGLSTFDNRVYNNVTAESLAGQFGLSGQRHYVFTQSLKTVKKDLQDWALDPEGWSFTDRRSGKPVQVTGYSLENLDKNEDDARELYNTVFYKERTTAERGLDQRLIATFSLKYRDYMRKLRDRKLKRAQKMIDRGTYGHESERSPKSLIKQKHLTKKGEQATKTEAEINDEKVKDDSRFDGFYCNATNLFKEECSTSQIAAIAHRRFEIEECFRIMKTDLKTRPMYHSKDCRIRAHLMICFLALTLIRGLERRISSSYGPGDRYPEGRYTVQKLLDAIRDINVVLADGGRAYIPDYDNSPLISDLLRIFDLTDLSRQVIMKDTMKKILQRIKTSPEMYRE